MKQGPGKKPPRIEQKIGKRKPSKRLLSSFVRVMAQYNLEKKSPAGTVERGGKMQRGQGVRPVKLTR
ncbi:hypothetical protein [Aquipseudomonas alcaligenes]|uniref:hypothetical protein n=1 Tax=Aquipseudomonas alcaligenes TaxID=43263 RepID=UPI001659AB5B|nr:hypothetical protein [Pseudomonas alcaligenes]